MTGIETAIAISAATSAFGALYSGVQQSQAADANAAMADQQAAQGRVAAGQQLAAGEAEAQRTERDSQRRGAVLQTGAAGAGLDATTGSPLDAMADTAAEGALDAQIQRWKARNNTSNTLVGSSIATQQAELDRQQGGAAIAGGFIKGGSTLLSSYAGYKMAGLRYGANNRSSDG